MLPKLVGQNEIYKRILNPEHITTFKTTANHSYKQARTKALEFARRKINTYAPTIKLQDVRAAFFVNWDAQSYYSLSENIRHLTMVMPEWLFVADSVDTAIVDIHAQALNLMRSHNVAVVPMISNFYNGRWNGDNVHRILSSHKKRERFIAQILEVLVMYKFQGVNIDFESLGKNAEEELIIFQRELFNALHPRGYLVTQDIAPLNSDYNLRELTSYNDYLVVMAYDMHYATSNPGPIADHKWVEGILGRICREVPSEKVLLSLAAYGYDWPNGDEAEDITYEEAIVRAREEEAEIIFDNSNYNLHFEYDDDNKVHHTVWFADAATSFNAMRAGSDYDIAGVALWRLGGEDSRIWNYFERELRNDSLAIHPFDISSMSTSRPSTGVDFEGEGEILDIVATPQEGTIKLGYNNDDQLISEENYQQLPTSYVIRKFGTAEKKIVLTFDDGPDPRYTPAILDILEAEHVPAAFFVLGENAESNLNLLRRLDRDGFEIGNHTFSHPNLAEISPERVRVELGATRRLIESVIGRSTVLFRAPYNADSEPETIQEIIPIVEAKEMNFYTVGESIDPLDWQKGVTADSIFTRIVAQKHNGSIILLHDAGGDRSQTVAVLPRVIRYFRDQGYTFTTICSLLGKTHDDIMPPLHDRKEVTLSQINWITVETIYWGEIIIFALFFIGIILSVARLVAVALLAFSQRRRQRDMQKRSSAQPLVSVIVPAYNEEITAVKTIGNLLHAAYPHLEIILIDDGSKDHTYQRVVEAYKGVAKVRVYTKPNGGKASALNYGIQQAHGELLVCIDADTVLDPDAIGNLVRLFDTEQVGAVAGNVKVGNERNMLTRWQAVEYITSQNFDRRAFDRLNAITVVPGAIGAFRTNAVNLVDGFATDTLAEDCDITMRLLAAGYDVRYADDALAFTEAPETMKMFLKQRFRWSFGIMQSIWKHRDMLFSHTRKNLGWIALPNMFLFQFILPLLSPLADLVMIASIIAGNWEQLFIYYLVFLVVDFSASAVAFWFEQESMSRLWLLIPQRFIYRQLMYWVLIKSMLSAMRGTLVGWGVLKRTGTAKISTK